MDSDDERALRCIVTSIPIVGPLPSAACNTIYPFPDYFLREYSRAAFLNFIPEDELFLLFMAFTTVDYSGIPSPSKPLWLLLEIEDFLRYFLDLFSVQIIFSEQRGKVERLITMHNARDILVDRKALFVCFPTFSICSFFHTDPCL